MSGTDWTVMLGHAECITCNHLKLSGHSGYAATCRPCLCAANAELAQMLSQARRWAEEGSALLSCTGYKHRLPWKCTNPGAHSEHDLLWDGEAG